MKTSRPGRLIVYGPLSAVCLYYLLPLFVMISTSSRPDEIRSATCFRCPPTPPAPCSRPGDGSCTGLSCDGLSGYFWNSMSFHRAGRADLHDDRRRQRLVLTMWRFRGSDPLFGLLMMGCFIPFQVVLLPMARTLAKFRYRQLGRRAGLYVVHGLAFTTLFFRNQYVTIPMNWSRPRRSTGAGFG